MFMHITTFGGCMVVHHIAKVSMDADLDAIAHGWAFGIVGGRKK